MYLKENTSDTGDNLKSYVPVLSTDTVWLREVMHKVEEHLSTAERIAAHHLRGQLLTAVLHAQYLYTMCTLVYTFLLKNELE